MSIDTLSVCHDGVVDPQEKGRFEGQSPSQNICISSDFQKCFLIHQVAAYR